MKTIKRVNYGKKETLPQDREYWMNEGGTVGTLNEWINGVFGIEDKIRVVDEMMGEDYVINVK